MGDVRDPPPQDGCGEDGEAPALEAISRLQCKKFIDGVRERTTASTGAMRHSGLSAVFGWLAAPGDDEDPYIDTNPTVDRLQQVERR